MTGSCPRARSLSTTCDPMNPDPPVTRTLMCSVSVPRTVVERYAGVVACDPIATREFHVVAHDPVTRLVINPAGRGFEPVEHDVLVEARDHAIRELEPARVLRVELLPGDAVLPRDDLGQALHLDQAERSGELVHPEVQPADLV